MKNRLLRSATVPFILIIICLLIRLTESVFHTDLHTFGVFPRRLSGLPGILTYPFIHAGWKHLFNNAVPLFVLGTMLYYFYREMATKTFIWVYLLSGVWLWMGGRENYHIGASGIVYALFGFLFMSGLLRKHLKLMALSLLVVFLYGGLIWGIFPIDDTISFEGHLAGLVAGLMVAVVYRYQGTQRPKYSWDFEDEEEDEEEGPETEYRTESEEQDAPADPPMGDQQPFSIRYIYKKNDES